MKNIKNLIFLSIIFLQFYILGGCDLCLVSQLATDQSVTYLSYSPNNCLAISNTSSNSVSFFSVGSNGSLTSTGTWTQDINLPRALDFSPNGNYLAVPNYNGSNTSGNVVVVLEIDNCTAVGEVAGSPYDSQGIDPVAVAYSTDGSCLAVANLGDPNDDLSPGNVAFFNVNSDGTLTFNTVWTENINKASALAWSPDGQYLAVANVGDAQTITVIEMTSCTPTSSFPPVSSGGDNPTSLAYSPTGTCLAVANNGSSGQSVSLFQVNGDGSLGTASTITEGVEFPSSVAWSPGGSCLAVANSGLTVGFITLFAINGCSFGASQNYTAGASPNSVAYSNSGEYLASASGFPDNTVSLLRTSPLITPSISALVPDCNCDLIITGRANASGGSLFPVTVTVSGDNITTQSTITSSNGDFKFRVHPSATQGSLQFVASNVSGTNPSGCTSAILTKNYNI